MKTTLFALAIASLLTCSTLIADDKPADKKPAGDQKTSTADAKKAPAINKYCAVEGGDHTVDVDTYTIYKGKKVGFCCADCVKDFESDPETYMAKLKARNDDSSAKTDASKKDDTKKDDTKKSDQK